MASEEQDRQREQQVDEGHEADVQLGHAFRRDIEDDNNVTERPENDVEHERASESEDASSDDATDNEGNPRNADPSSDDNS